MIGIFDSGSGGFTVARALRALAPRADILYFGDTAHAPYGTKTDAELLDLTLNIVRFLRAHGATTVVSACNSVSASVIRPMLHIETSGLVEMVGPAVGDLVERGVKSVAVLATEATCRSGMYRAACAEQRIECVEISCPTLASLIENGAPEVEISAAVDAAVASIPSDIRDVLLGCTHYPLAFDTFRRAANASPRRLTFIDPSQAVAEAAIKLAGVAGEGKTMVVCSKRTPTFDRFAREMLGVDPSEIAAVSK